MSSNRFQNLVGARIRCLRTAAGISQGELATRLQLAGWDISRGGLSKIEACLRRVNDAELWMLGNVLGCPLGELFPDDPKEIRKALRQGKDRF